MQGLFLFVVAAVVAGTVTAQLPPPDTVDQLDVPLYLGRWYQMYTNLLVNITFERDAFCVTADYGPINETFVSVYNANTEGGPTGELNEINGYAFVKDPSEPGKLLVQLERGVPVPQQYWILLLGPEVASLYQYAVVSNENRGTLFVLARNVEEFRENYQDGVLEYLAQNGFDTPTNEPLETYQAADCEYAPVPEF